MQRRSADFYVSLTRSRRKLLAVLRLHFNPLACAAPLLAPLFVGGLSASVFNSRSSWQLTAFVSGSGPHAECSCVQASSFDPRPIIALRFALGARFHLVSAKAAIEKGAFSSINVRRRTLSGFLLKCLSFLWMYVNITK